MCMVKLLHTVLQTLIEQKLGFKIIQKLLDLICLTRAVQIVGNSCQLCERVHKDSWIWGEYLHVIGLGHESAFVMSYFMVVTSHLGLPLLLLLSLYQSFCKMLIHGLFSTIYQYYAHIYEVHYWSQNTHMKYMNMQHYLLHYITVELKSGGKLYLVDDLTSFYM